MPQALFRSLNSKAILFILFLAVAPCVFQTDSVGRSQESTAKLDPAMAASQESNPNLDWYDVRSWGVEGRILPDQERKQWFDRLPGFRARQSDRQCLELKPR